MSESSTMVPVKAGLDIRVWTNPSKDELNRIFTKSGAARAYLFWDDHRLLVWDAYEAVHADLDHVLDADMGADKLVLFPDHIEYCTFRDDPDPEEIEEEDVQWIGEASAVVRAYGKPMYVDFASIFG